MCALFFFVYLRNIIEPQYKQYIPMEKYIVSARKYRPSAFDAVVGQQALTTTLKNAIATGKLAHAYLFCGPRGVGKTTCARIFAKTINCLSPLPGGEACGECESCRAFNEGRSLNIYELDAASNNSVDDIRALTETVLTPPQVGRYKVYIIDEVHMLSQAAFNAFLKTLEEPPSYVVFILATTEKHKILPTILSRCQVYDFNRMGVEQIVAHLEYVAQQEGFTYEPEALNIIAQKADGGMRDALSIFDQAANFSEGNLTYQKVISTLNVLDYDYYFKLVDLFLSNEPRPCMVLLNEVLGKGFDAQQFISGLASHLRDLMMSQDASTLSLLEVSDAVKVRYQQQAARCNPKFLYSAIKLCSDCDLNYRVSKNKRLLVEITLIQLAQLTEESTDGASAGRSPRKILKPLFNKLVAPATSAVINGYAAQAQAMQGAVKESMPQTTHPQATPAAGANTATMNEHRSYPLPRQDAGSKTRVIPTIKPSEMGFSIRMGTQQNAASQATHVHSNTPTMGSTSTQAQASTQSDMPSMHGASQAASSRMPAQDQPPIQAKTNTPSTPTRPSPKPFTIENISFYWHEFINMMPRTEIALSQRMKLIKPKIVSDGIFEVAVDNEQVKQYMMNVAARIEAHIAGRLGRDKVEIQVKVNEHNESVHVFSKPQQLAEMIKQNPALAKLKEAFHLELM